MQILEHVSLSTAKVQQQYRRVRDALASGDFGAAQVKKLQNAPFYRAKLGDAHRLLFKLGTYQGERVILILEVLLNHDYQGSRFLRGATISDDDFVPVNLEGPQQGEEQLRYINPASTTFHLIDKPVSFNPEQEDVYLASLPLILIGSAGSGKTVLTLEKLRLLTGRVLYLSLSRFLVENARRLYSLATPDEQSNVEFLSFNELLGMIAIPSGREIRFSHFAAWCARQSWWAKQNSRKIFEEFRGVLAGSTSADGGPLGIDDYQQLGIKQSIFLADDRAQVFELFRRYRAWLPQTGLYDSTLLAHHYLPRATPTFDCIVVDEVQDFTVPQLSLILRMGKNSHQFILCGDSNQIVHPNFFSWSRVKSFFFARDDDVGPRIIRVLRTNFRNAQNITTAANTLLSLKQRRFGSIDKESNFLVESVADERGFIAVVELRSAGVSKLNEASRLSTQYAVIVLDDTDKERARQVFDTPLIFSVHEAKGLEYPHVILYGFVASAPKEYRALVGDMTPDDLSGDISFARARDKSDKSLEIYKFYVNALYVGITRALTKVFVVDEVCSYEEKAESRSRCRYSLWELLQIPVASSDLSLNADSSTAEEWSKEARRLELQGKLEQAQEIRDKILQTQKVPWQVPTRDSIDAMCGEAVGYDRDLNKRRMIELFEIAEGQGMTPIQDFVNSRENAPTKSWLRARDLMIEKHYSHYTARDPRHVLANITKFGIDYQNEFGETPLMIASRLFKRDLVKKLLEEGANPQLCTYGGLTPARGLLRELMLRQQTISRRQAEDALDIWRLIAEPLLLSVSGRLIKLLPHQGEYTLFEAIASMLVGKFWQTKLIGLAYGIESRLLFQDYASLHLSLLPEYRARRDYVNALLAKNEIEREGSTNKLLFMRLRRGSYILNPLIKTYQPIHAENGSNGASSDSADAGAAEDENWRPIYDVLGAHFMYSHQSALRYPRTFETVLGRHADAARERLSLRPDISPPSQNQAVGPAFQTIYPPA
jgi:hypothetical protein